MLEEIGLLGFDARELCSSFQEAWSRDRRESFLLRADVERPLSVDNAVWDTVFEVSEELLVRRAQHGRILPKLPDWIGSHIDIWSCLDELHRTREALDRLLCRPYSVIAIAIVRDSAVLNYISHHRPETSLIHLEEAEPGVIDPNWRFLGFDVADPSRLSGLMNCYYTPEEKPKIARAFSGHLSKYHLFGDLQSARRFQDSSNDRVPEHAPFFIYTIYEIVRVY